MKKSVVFAGLMAMSTIIFAQEGGRNHDRTAMNAKRIERMKTELSLTEDQVTKVKAINEKFTKSFELLRKDTAISVGASRARARKLIDNQQSEIKSVLTPAQQTKWAEYKDKHRGGKWRHKGESENHKK
jgi:Spy/CpxP family protein refolding chaperone